MVADLAVNAASWRNKNFFLQLFLIQIYHDSLQEKISLLGISMPCVAVEETTRFSPLHQ